MKAFVLAGVSSGVGKTTIATGVIGALARRGLRVQPFKAGPDYIDPTYHSTAAGVPSRNLDGWMLGRDALLELFQRAASKADVAVVEGVMGLFDGRAGENGVGSTADLAKTLGAPVVLVVDASKMAQSAAALVLGYKTYDPALRVAGVILNNIGSEGHYRMTAQPIETATGLPVLGYLPRGEDLKLPERHLGLVPTVEGPAGREFFERVAERVARHVDLDRLLALAADVRPTPRAPVLFPAQPVARRCAIAVARDKAFSFYYQDSLDLLEAWGAELRPFSPLADAALPPDVSGVYIGGGFPEMYASGLAANDAMKASLREAASRGVPMYGECGGLMYLGESIVDMEGRRQPMVGLTPARSTMTGRKLTLGYRTVRARRATPILGVGDEVRGHEFHWSVNEGSPDGATAVYDVLDQPGRVEGYSVGSVTASYVHLHLGARPGLARRFVESCPDATARADRLT